MQPTDPARDAPSTRHGALRTWKALLLVLVGLFVAANVAYRFGAVDLRVRSGASVSFGRETDVALLGIREGVAILVDASSANEPDELAVVDVAKVAPPFSLVCGSVVRDGFARDPSALAPLFGDKLVVTPHPTPGERPRVTVRMRLDEATKAYAPLSVCQESCMIFNAAFFLLFAAMLVVGAALGLRARARGSA